MTNVKKIKGIAPEKNLDPLFDTCGRQSIRRFCSNGLRLRRQISRVNSLKSLQMKTNSAIS